MKKMLFYIKKYYYQIKKNKKYFQFLFYFLVFFVLSLSLYLNHNVFLSFLNINSGLALLIASFALLINVISTYHNIQNTREIRIQSQFEKKPILMIKRKSVDKDKIVIELQNVGGIAMELVPVFIQHAVNDNIIRTENINYLKSMEKKKVVFNFPPENRFPGCCGDEYICQYRDVFGNKYEASTHRIYEPGVDPVIPLLVEHKEKFKEYRTSLVDYTKE